MPHKVFPLHILADASHARLVVHRSEHPFRIETAEALDHVSALAARRAEIRSHPPGSVHESAQPGRHRVGPEDRVRQEKAAFMDEVADEAVRLAARHATDKVVIVAPPRLAPVLRKAIGDRLVVSAELHRDLIKVADRDLGAWLSPEMLRPDD